MPLRPRFLRLFDLRFDLKRLPLRSINPSPDIMSNTDDSSTLNAMSNDKRSDRKIADPLSPYFLVPTENPNASLVSNPLTGGNYPTWVKAARRSLKARRKIGFVEGTIKKPDQSSPDFEDWDVNNSMITSWIHNSLDKKLQNAMAYVDDAYKLWQLLKTRYSQGNEQRIYQLKKEISRLEQGAESVTAYFERLSMLWEELEEYNNISSCSCGHVCSCGHAVKKAQEGDVEKLYQFLMGLQSEVYAVSVSNILNTKPLPTVDAAFSIINQEEQRRHPSGVPREEEAAAFSVIGNNSSTSNNSGRRQRERPFCDHCNKPGHVRSTCWQLHGYPPEDDPRRNGRGRGRGRGNQPQPRSKTDSPAFAAPAAPPSPAPTESTALTTVTESPKTNPGFTDDQYRALLNMLKGAHDRLSGISTTDGWLLDSGASQHMTGNARLLHNCRSLSRPSSIILPDGRRVSARSEGELRLGAAFVLPHVLLVPHLSYNLISLRQLTADLNCFVTLFPDFCVIQDLPTKMLIGTGEISSGVYRLRGVTDNSKQISNTTLSFAISTDNPDLWHKRLGHPSISAMNFFGNFNKLRDIPCDTCIRAKHSRSSFSISANKADAPFELIHCDVWGPYSVPSLSKARYFLTVVDDHSRAVWIYLLVAKSEVCDFLVRFYKMALTQFGRKIKILRSDNGTEFTSSRAKQFYADNGILHQTSCVDTPQQNGRAERKHRHILNVARALKIQASLPIKFWGECVLTAAVLINYTPSRLLSGKSPYEVLFGRQPNYDNLRVFGSLCYAHWTSRPIDKFNDRAKRCIFLGYPPGRKAWKVFDLESQQLFESRDVTFYEQHFPFQGPRDQPVILDPPTSEAQLPATQLSPAVPFDYPEPPPLEEISAAPSPDSRDPPIEENPEGPLPDSPGFPTSPHLRGSSPLQALETEHEAQPASTSSSSERPDLVQPTQPPAPRRSDRVRYPHPRYRNFVCHASHSATTPLPASQISSSGTVYPLQNYLSHSRLSSSHMAFVASLDNHTEPTSYTQAMRDPRWREAMRHEINALEENGTWTLQSLPPGKRPIGCKWVFKIKYNSDGTVERYKARLVAKGFTQVEGMDYHETFAPVARITSLRCLLAVALARGWSLCQLDVHNAFLHGDLDEEVYMRPPPGFKPSRPDTVCRLRKSLYGLRQASRNWYSKFASALITYGFCQSDSDHSLFTYFVGPISLVVLLYVDDIVLASNNRAACDDFKSYLAHLFRIKDLGRLRYFLGIEIAMHPSGLFLCQRKYALDILAESGQLGARPATFPMEQRHSLRADSGDLLPDPDRYRRLVGRLIYLTITRPDLCYAVHLLSQFMQSPRQPHWDAALRVLRYIKSSPGQGIFMPRPTSPHFQAFCDADWAGCPTTRRSITGFFVTLGGCPISWRTKKQTTVSRSSAEAEYRAMAATTAELLWLRGLLRSLGVHLSQPMVLMSDNQSAIQIAANPVFHERTKHIEIDCHFIREHIHSGHLITRHVSSAAQLADIFTKALGRDRFQLLSRKLGILNIHAPT